MAEVCHDGQFWDRLVRNCMPCQMICKQPFQLARCIEFCVVMDCIAVPGNFYDRLLNRCLRCVDVCGRHPLECSQVCQVQPTRESFTRVAADLPVGHTPAISERTHPGGGFHMAVIYSLLGLCLTMLVCTVTLALLVLWKRTKRQRKAADHRGGDPNGNENQGSSKDRLMEVHGPLEEKLSQPSETCIHCFPDLKVSGRGGDKQPLHMPKPTPTVYQQAAVAGPSGPLAGNEPFHPTEAKDGVLRIICSPSQSSS